MMPPCLTLVPMLIVLLSSCRRTDTEYLYRVDDFQCSVHVYYFTFLMPSQLLFEFAMNRKPVRSRLPREAERIITCSTLIFQLVFDVDVSCG